MTDSGAEGDDGVGGGTGGLAKRPLTAFLPTATTEFVIEVVIPFISSAQVHGMCIRRPGRGVKLVHYNGYYQALKASAFDLRRSSSALDSRQLEKIHGCPRESRKSLRKPFYEDKQQPATIYTASTKKCYGEQQFCRRRLHFPRIIDHFA